jgi:hypothetical protein
VSAVRCEQDTLGVDPWPFFGSASLLATHDRYEEQTRQALGAKAFDHGATQVSV